MEFFETVKARHSIRAFKDKAVEEEKLKKILETANSAPSAHDLQAYEIVVVRDKKRKAALTEAASGQSFITQAPVVLVVLANPKRCMGGDARGQFYCILDAAIAASYIQLAAADLDLGTVWVGSFDDEAVREIVAAPEEMRPVAIIPVGYAAEKPRPTPRRKLSDLVHEEKF